jgi:hypothetical protein
MATTPLQASWTVDDLLAAVKQLPDAELREFQRRLASWSQQNNAADQASPLEQEEEALLAAIRDNSTLPPAEQRRFERLRRKRQAGTLTGPEEKQLQALWQQVEQMNATRLEALAHLARRRGTDVRTLMRHLGIPENRDVF